MICVALAALLMALPGQALAEVHGTRDSDGPFQWAEEFREVSGTGESAGTQLTKEEADAALAEGVESWLSNVEWEELDAILNALPPEVRTLWEGRSLRSIAQEIALSGTEGGGAETVEDQLLPWVGRMVQSECARLAGVAATLIGLALIGGLTGALLPGKKESVGAAAAFVCRCFTLIVVLSAFGSSAALAVECVGSICQCMELINPVLMTLLTAIGGTASVGVFQPSMTLLASGVAASLESVVLPLVVCGGVLSLFDCLSERVRLGEMGALCRQAVKWIIGIVTTLYTGVTALRGMTAAAYDGIAVRTAKYAAGSMFPMVGGLVTGSFDTVLGCAGLVKNGAGVTAILLCLSIAAAPLLRLTASMLLLRVTAAIIQPVAQKEQLAMCKTGADMLSGLLSACVAVTAMFVVTIGLVVGAGNVGMVG